MKKANAVEALCGLVRLADKEPVLPEPKGWLWYLRPEATGMPQVAIGRDPAHLYAYRSPWRPTLPTRYAILVGPELYSIKDERRTGWVEAPDRIVPAPLTGRMRTFLPDVSTAALAPSLPPKYAAHAVAMRPGTWPLALDLLPGPTWWVEGRWLEERSNRENSEQLGKKERKRQRSWRQEDRWPPSQVPLVKDEAQLRALIALRCFQQRCGGEEMLTELRRYVALVLKVHPDEQEEPDNLALLWNVANQVVQYAVDYPPNGLPAHIRAVARAVRSKRWTEKGLEVSLDNAHTEHPPDELLSVYQFARLVGVAHRARSTTG